MRISAIILSLFGLSQGSHLDDDNGIFANFSFDHIKFKTQTNCQLDTYPEIRKFLEGDAAQYPETPVLVANDGLPRVELFKEGAMVDTIHVHRFSNEALNNLFEELGQPRDHKRSWESLEAEKKLFDSLHGMGGHTEL